MYLRVAIPTYRHTDKDYQNDQISMGPNAHVPGSGASGLSDHIKNASHGKGHVEYQIEVVSNYFGDPDSRDTTLWDSGGVQLGQGRFFRLTKRYSAFLALHNEVSLK